MATVLMVVLWGVLGGCGTGARSGTGVEPLAGPGATAAPSGPAGPPDADAAAHGADATTVPSTAPSFDPAPAPSVDPGPAGAGPADSSTGRVPGTVDPTLVRTAAAAVDRYDAALTEVARDPAAVVDPMHPARMALDAANEPGSVLVADVLARMAGLWAREGAVVLPPEGGRSWVHRVTVAVPTVDGSLLFSWCGWAPGRAVELATGRVVDDSVAVSNGIGAAVRVGDAWVVAELTQLASRLEPAGTPDPCPGAGDRP